MQMTLSRFVSTLVLAGILGAGSALAADPVFTRAQGQTIAQALDAFEAKLSPEQKKEVNSAFRWLAQHNELDWSHVDGKSADQIIALARQHQGYHAATLAHAKREPERIRFAKGAVEGKADGDLGPHGMQPFVIAAEGGQEMHVTVEPLNKLPSPVGDPGEAPLILIIYGKDGTVMMTDHASSSTFAGPIPSTQDYYIDVRSLVDKSAQFTLTVKIVTPEKAASTGSKETVKKATISEESWQTKPMKPGQFAWHPDAEKEGSVNVVVSLSQQEAFVYRGGVMIGRTTVSTGRKGHRTPTGVFHILSKERMHHSKKYDNAAMPFSERITWGGVFLHAGIVPGYESSHGCIHLPYKFAKDLYGVTSKGDAVMITKERVHHAATEPQKYVVMATEPAKK